MKRAKRKRCCYIERKPDLSFRFRPISTTDGSDPELPANNTLTFSLDNLTIDQNTFAHFLVLCTRSRIALNDSDAESASISRDLYEKRQNK